MGLKEDLQNKINVCYNESFDVENTSIVPTTDYSKLTFGNKVLRSDLTFLFVDIRKSSKIIEILGFADAARLYQSFHDINTKIIAKRSGQIRSFDGDRVLGIFSGDRKNNNAVEAAMNIRWAILNILNAKLGDNKINIGIGIDTGETLITKVGKIGGGSNSDIVWVTKACNNAALYCSKGENEIHIGTSVYNKLNEKNKIVDGNNMWKQVSITNKLNQLKECYKTTYYWGHLE